MNNGIALESEYPYMASEKKCKPYKPQTVLSNACLNLGVTEDVMKISLLKFGPLVIAISE